MDIKEIGNRIHTARLMRKVTLDDIASDISVAKSTVQRYEKGLIITPKIPVLQAIAHSLKVSPDWILLKTDDMNAKEIVEEPKNLEIVRYYNNLNDTGKREAIKRVKELTYIPKYQSHLIVQAAHNDDSNSTEEQKKIARDLEKLKRPD